MPRVPPITPAEVNAAFTRLVECAVKNMRAPSNTKTPGNNSGTIRGGALKILIEQRRIRTEVYAHNYRVIEITSGEHDGRRTRPPADKTWRPYKVTPAPQTERE